VKRPTCVLVVALVVLPAYVAACATTESLGRKTQHVRIVTEPENAMVYVGTGDARRFVGHAPQTMTTVYDATRTTFDHAWWAAPALSAVVVAMGGVVWKVAPARSLQDSVWITVGASTMWAAGGAAFTASLIACAVQESRARGIETAPEPREVSISAVAEGYDLATATVTSPGDDADVKIVLFPRVPLVPKRSSDQ
jgi:hypothetical protein